MRVHQRGEDALEGSAELHGFARGPFQGLAVHPGKRVIDNQPWAPVALRHHAQRGHAKALEIRCGFIGQHEPVTLAAEIQHFASHEFALAV
jgi:hypothetical protein